MPYNKSDGSRHYNKEERGGWYCTNPKRHEENETHHAADVPHEHHHRAERNDREPERQPQARQVRKPDDGSQSTASANGNKGCVKILLFMIFSFIITVFFSICAVILSGDDNESQPDIDYTEYYESSSL